MYQGAHISRSANSKERMDLKAYGLMSAKTNIDKSGRYIEEAQKLGSAKTRERRS